MPKGVYPRDAALRSSAEYIAAQKEARRIREKEYRQNNKSRAAVISAKWVKENREKRLLIQKRANEKRRLSGKTAAWRDKNKEKELARVKAWQASNPATLALVREATKEKRRASGAQKKSEQLWVSKNKDKVRAKVKARLSRKRNACPSWVDMAAIRAVYLQAKINGLTVDHIIPLRHPLVSGLHVPWNLQLMSSEENASKGNLFDGVRGYKNAHT